MMEQAINKKVVTFRINGKPGVDYKTFIQKAKEPTIALVNKQSKPIKLRLVINCRFDRIVDKKSIYIDSHFSTKNEVVTEATNLATVYDIKGERLIEIIDNFQTMGSGWIFQEVLYFDIFINPFKPLAASSYIPLPKFLANKKATINPINEDQESFKWAITEVVYPQEEKCERITNKSKENAANFNWTV